MTKIQELEQKLDNAVEKFRLEMNECQKALAELKKSKKEGKWKPVEKEQYWYRDADGKIYTDFWSNHIYDEFRYKHTPIFKTEEECERYWRFMDTVKEKSYEFSDLEWRNEDIKKWVIQYDYMINQLVVVDHLYIKQFGMVYFKDKESAQYIIDNFKDELMEFFL